jgi:hypothetical protein
MEQRIVASDLIRQIPAILKQVCEQGAVFLIEVEDVDPRWVISSLVGDSGKVSFVIGPPRVFWRVFGLIDPEYGWPAEVHAKNIKEVADVMPSHRRHPMIYVGSEVVALSIGIKEYAMIKALPTL